MQGEKGDKIRQNRGDKLFNRIAYSVKFQKAIKLLRKKYGIKEAGCFDIREIYDWYGPMHKDFNKIRSKFLSDISCFLRKQVLPNNEWWNKKIYEYILTDGQFSFLPRTQPSDPFIEVLDRNFSKAGFNQGYYVDLRIYESVSQRDIINYIKHNWNYIRPTSRTGISKKIREEKDPVLNKKLIALWEESAKKEKTDDSNAKEIRVSNKLEKETGKRLEFESIKMRIHRKRHAKR